VVSLIRTVKVRLHNVCSWLFSLLSVYEQLISCVNAHNCNLHTAAVKNTSICRYKFCVIGSFEQRQL